MSCFEKTTPIRKKKDFLNLYLAPIDRSKKEAGPGLPTITVQKNINETNSKLKLNYLTNNRNKSSSFKTFVKLYFPYFC